MSITQGYLHKPNKLDNLVKAGHKRDLLLAIFEHCVYQSKNSQFKQTHIEVKLNEPFSKHLITALGIPESHIFHSCSFDVISPSFAYQDGGLHTTSFSTLNANILRTRGDIEKRSTAFFPILTDLSSENNMFFGG